METKMQKLSGKLKNTPIDTSLVCGSVSSELNKEETLGVQNEILPDNSLEENQRQQTDGLNVKVFVLNKNGEPLMPCKPAKARHLLEQGKAKVVSRKPFTIRLDWDCEINIQPITLGIDSGYSFVGFSAVTEKQEVISGELKLRKDVSKRLEERAMYRKNKRNKLWYRQPRFNNRVKSKKKGWLAPSIQHKLDSHIRLVAKIKSLLPITDTIIEVASFDTQKMQNPEISGVEYQQGKLQGYEVREYLLEKWGRKCVYCKKKDLPLQVEHIIPKSRGGNSRVSNLTISCERCNLKKNTQTAEEFGFPEIQARAEESLKSTAFMNVVRKMLVEKLRCGYTYGYITKHNRIKAGLEKTHYNDAFVIADGNGQERSKPYSVMQTRRNNRCLQLNRKGFKPSVRKKRYMLQPNDLVRYNDVLYKTKGVHCKGTRVMLDNKKSVATSKVELIVYGKGIQFNTEVKSLNSSHS